MTPEPVEEGACPPRWFEAGVLGIGAATGIIGSVGLALALGGVYSTWLTLLVSSPLLVGAGFLVWRAIPAGRASATAQWAAGAALALALAFSVFAGATPSQNVIVARDPGSYLNTAKWLTQEGSLRVDPSEGAFDGIEALRFTGATVYVDDDGDLEFQFNHLASVVMAVADDIGGYRLMLRLPALASGIGLLALYAVAVRVMRRPVLALVPPALFAVCLPLLHVSRNTYSEPFAFLLLWTAILVLCRMHRRPTIAGGVLGGVLLGAGLCVRIDSLIYVALALPLAALSMATSTTEGRERTTMLRAWCAALACLIVVGGIGLADLQWRTGQYASHLEGQVSMMRLAFLGSLFLSVVGYLAWTHIAALRRVLPPLLRAIAPFAAVAVVLVMVGLWFVRPEVQLLQGPEVNTTVEALQSKVGEQLDGRRTYAEDSMRWMSWYLGAPALIAMIGGLALTVRATLRGTARPAAVLVAAVVLGAGGLYLWNPSITPDQLWATRRFVPAVLPAMAVMAAVALASIDAVLRGGLRGRRIDDRVRIAVVAALSLLMVVPAAATTWPVRSARAQSGHLQMVLEACDIAGDDAAIIVLGGLANLTLAQTLRSWCGVPVAGQGDAVNAETVEEIARQIEANGYVPFLIGANADHLNTFVDATGRAPIPTHALTDDWTADVTLEGPPTTYRPWQEANPFAEPFQLHLLPLDGLG